MNKVLLIRFSSIGDIVLTSPVIRCLKKAMPEVLIHCVTKPAYATIYRQNPMVDKVIELNDSLWKTIFEMRKENYDLVVDLHHNQRTALVKAMLMRPWVSFHKLNMEKWLMVNLKINHLPDIHIVDRYLNTVRKLGVSNDGKGLDFFIPPDEEFDTAVLPESHRKGYIAVVTGAKFATKKMPVARLAEICRRIKHPVVLLGGREDIKDADELLHMLGDQCYNLCNELSLNQSASVVRQADLVLTNDTGLMHIAAAFDRKIITFWGNTIPEFGMYPYYPSTSQNKPINFEIKGLACRPCSKIGFGKCPRKHFRCMMDIDVNEVTEAARRLLTGTNG